MARRNDIDWEAIERDYRAGTPSILAIAKAHGVSDSQIRASAKAGGWKRDLGAAINARTQAKISTIDVAELIEQSASKSAGQSAEMIQSAIEQASDIAAGIIIKHRASIRLEHERGMAIESLLDSALSSAVEIKDIATVAQTYKSLVDSKSKLREQERTAFNLDKGDASDKPPISVVEYVVIE